MNYTRETPWKIAAHTGVIINRDGYMVAHVGAIDRKQSNDDFITERDANARLVAAAPELHEAVSFAIHQIKEHIQKCHTPFPASCPVDSFINTALWELEKALAKSDGETK